jgi:hypothetical protein
MIFFLSSRAITLWKINGSKPNSKLICILVLQSQCNKYQMNICKQSTKRCGKLMVRDFFLSPRAITLWKMNGSELNSLKLDLYLGMAKQCTKYQMNICNQREEKVRKTVKSLKGYNSSKNWSIATIFELDLQVIHIKPCTKFQCNSCAHSRKKSGKLWTDGQTDGYKTYSSLRLHR